MKFLNTDRYAAGASVQVLLFGVLAIEVKRKAPRAHTFLEIILARWGHTAHKVFLMFAFLTNMLVTSMLLLGGSSTVSALTGVDINLASFLIPISVISCMKTFNYHIHLKSMNVID